VLYYCEPRYEFHVSKAQPGGAGACTRAIRESKHWTLARLARETRIAEPNLSRLENDKVHPTLETLEKVARAFGVPLRMLIEKQSAAPVSADR